MRFEWDAAKNRSNQKKHARIDFETASRVFADPDLMLRKDRVVDGEQRWHAIGAVFTAVLIVAHVYRGKTKMAKKLSASSRPGKQIRVSAESIWSKPLTERQKASLDRARKRQQSAKPAAMDYSDIPVLTDKQLSQFRRPAKKLVAVRLDADVFEWLQQYGAGYSTRINNVLRAVMSRTRLQLAAEEATVKL
jgi:uncharacterized DUF497 family protein